MSENLRRFVEDVFFWLPLTFDFLLVWSLTFSLFYAAALGLGSLMPLTRKLAPRAWGLPVLLVLALAAVFSAPGELTARVLGSQAIPLMIKAGSERLPLIMAAIWLTGAGLGLFRLTRNALKLKKMLAALDRTTDPVLQEALRIMNFRRPVALKKSARGFQAASWGLFKALIIIPEDFHHYDRRERLGVYLHELSHIRNRDSLKYLLMSGLDRLMWFNPILDRAIERYRCHLEIVCDRKVTGLGRISSLEYAKLIAKQAESSGGLLSGFSGSYQSAARRFSYIFNDRGLRPVKQDRLTAVTCLAAALLLWFAAGFQPAFSESKAEFEEMVASRPAPAGGTARVIFFWQGALGSYSQVVIDK